MPHDRAADRTALEQLALSCEPLAPRVALEPTEQPTCLFLDVTEVPHLFGGEAQLVAHIRRHFQQRGYTVRIALADTVGAAWGLARFGDGSDHVGWNNDPSAFAQLPIEALRLSPSTAETLRRLGVERVEQVQRLPRVDLWARFGDELHRRLDQLSGAQEETLPWLPPPVDWYAQRFLDFPATDAAQLQWLIAQLVGQLCQELRGRQRGGLHWECRLDSADQPPVHLAVSLFQPAADVRHVMPLFRMQWEQRGLQSMRRGKSPRHSVTEDNAPLAVHHIRVSVRHSAVLVDRQRLLFDEHPRLDRQELSQLINRLSARLGTDRVLRARLAADAQPELANRFEPLVGAEAAERGTERSPPLGGRSPLCRPLQLFSPLPIEVLSESESGSPACLSIGGTGHHVVRCWGPERIETGWWRGPSVRRDYWRAELDDGRWLWLFRELRSRAWFCHGAF